MTEYDCYAVNDAESPETLYFLGTIEAASRKHAVEQIAEEASLPPNFDGIDRKSFKKYIRTYPEMYRGGHGE